jgi:hypothetical protein
MDWKIMYPGLEDHVSRAGRSCIPDWKIMYPGLEDHVSRTGDPGLEDQVRSESG